MGGSLMLKNFTIFLILFFLIIPILIGQKSNKMIQQISINYNSYEFPLTEDINIDVKIMPVVNTDSLLLDDEKNLKEFPDLPYRFGYSHSVALTLKNVGTWDELKDGGRIWRLKIYCPKAYSINLIYNKFFLPEGSFFSIYDSSKKFILGAFTSQNNKKHSKFATDLLPGEICYLEYFEPFKVKGEGIIEISNIIHGYKDIIIESYDQEKYSKDIILQSGDCNRDANCSEGDDFCREKYSVSKLIMGVYSCSGSLINNAHNDYTPYYLTANHCYECLVDPDYWIFKFGYMYQYCNGIYTLPTFSYTGADLKARWASSDFALMELQEKPESGEDNFPDVFFSGWDRTGNIPVNTTCIHHPSGDRMKISQDYDEPVITGFLIPFTDCAEEQNDEYHWRVVWNSGTTENGSSGSPLYDPYRRIIGQLHGGCASCENTTGTKARDYFGRLYFSWNGGGTSSTRLKDWLDPDNTGVEVLDGIHLPNNHWGEIYSYWNNETIRAYDVLKVGSSDIPVPFVVEDGATINLKAGREIQMLPCTQILAGSEFRAFIEELDCDEDVWLSDKDDDYSNSCGSYPNLLKAKEEETLSFDKIIINQFSLSHNIPNPFSGTTEIIYSLPKPSPVIIQVYNSIGLPIFELVSLPIQQPGEYRVSFDAANLSDGVYFYTMRTPEFIETKQMVLLK
jgi:hypothetical protein